MPLGVLVSAARKGYLAQLPQLFDLKGIDYGQITHHTIPCIAIDISEGNRTVAEGLNLA